MYLTVARPFSLLKPISHRLLLRRNQERGYVTRTTTVQLAFVMPRLRTTPILYSRLRPPISSPTFPALIRSFNLSLFQTQRVRTVRTVCVTRLEEPNYTPSLAQNYTEMG